MQSAQQKANMADDKIPEGKEQSPKMIALKKVNDTKELLKQANRSLNQHFSENEEQKDLSAKEARDLEEYYEDLKEVYKGINVSLEITTKQDIGDNKEIDVPFWHKVDPSLWK